MIPKPKELSAGYPPVEDFLGKGICKKDFDLQ